MFIFFMLSAVNNLFADAGTCNNDNAVCPVGHYCPATPNWGPQPDNDNGNFSRPCNNQLFPPPVCNVPGFYCDGGASGPNQRQCTMPPGTNSTASDFTAWNAAQGNTIASSDNCPWTITCGNAGAYGKWDGTNCVACTAGTAGSAGTITGSGPSSAHRHCPGCGSGQFSSKDGETDCWSCPSNSDSRDHANQYCNCYEHHRTGPGWAITSDNNTTNDHTVPCTRPSQTIEFNLNYANGGSTAINDITCNRGQACNIPVIGDRTRTGHTFRGWSRTPNWNASGTSCHIDMYHPGNRTFADNTAPPTRLHACWEPNILPITLNANGGAAGTPGPLFIRFGRGWFQDATATTSISNITIPERHLYTFEGYFTTANSGSTEIINRGGAILGGHLTRFETAATIHARWERCPDCAPTGGATCELGVDNNRCTYTTNCSAGHGPIERPGQYNPHCAPCQNGTFKPDPGTGPCSHCNTLTQPTSIHWTWTTGTFSTQSDSGAIHNTECQYRGPPRPDLEPGCATVTANLSSFNGTAWDNNFYTVTASNQGQGWIIQHNNSAAATCTACTGESWSAGGNATECTDCMPLGWFDANIRGCRQCPGNTRFDPEKGRTASSCYMRHDDKICDDHDCYSIDQIFGSGTGRCHYNPWP